MSMDFCHHCSRLVDTDYELEFYGADGVHKCANCRDGEPRRTGSSLEFERFIEEQELLREDTE